MVSSYVFLSLFGGYLLVFDPVLRAFVFECLLRQALVFPVIRRSSRGSQGSDGPNFEWGEECTGHNKRRRAVI